MFDIGLLLYVKNVVIDYWLIVLVFIVCKWKCFNLFVLRLYLFGVCFLVI